MLRCDLYELFCKPGQQDTSTGQIVAVCLEGHQLLRLDLRIAPQEGINARSVVEEIPDLGGGAEYCCVDLLSDIYVCTVLELLLL